MKKIYHAPFIFCLGIIFGIGSGSWFEIGSRIILVSLILSIIIIVAACFFKKSLLILTGIFIVGAAIGLSLVNRASLKLDQSRKSNITEETTIHATVVSEEDEREKYSRYTVKSGEEKILLTANKYQDYVYGETLILTGNLETPSSTEEFDYQGYLAKDGVYLTMAFPQIERNGQDQSFKSQFYRSIFALKSRIRRNFIQSFPLREADFIRALVLGDKGTINPALRQSFSRTGTSHVIAISGLHLSILTIFIFNIFLKLGFWRNQATVITIIFLISFLIFIGPIASLIRSVIMAILALLGLSLGKIFQGERVLTYAACIMLILNPLLLRYDIGFQLSYLAVFGMFVFKPPFDRLFERFKIPQSTNDMLTTTLAAQIPTLPIIIANFQIISVIAPFINILVLFFFPLILGTGFALAILSLLFNITILASALYPILSLILSFILWAGNLPFAAITLSRNYQFALINLIYYLFCAVFIIWWKKFYQARLTPLAKWTRWQNP